MDPHDFKTGKLAQALPGDSGGPVFAVRDGRRYLVGILSNGSNVFTQAVNLGHAKDWIQSIIQSPK